MELEKFIKAKEIVELHDGVDSAYNDLCVERDFNKVDMQILFREHGEEGTRCIWIPNQVAHDVVSSIRSVLKNYERSLKSKFIEL